MLLGGGKTEMEEGMDNWIKKNIHWIYLFLLLCAAFSFAVLLISFHNQASKLENQNKRLAAQAAKIEHQNNNISELSVKNCKQIESLKKIVRDEANENFKSLGKNLRVLRITLTLEIIRIAREARDLKRMRYAPSRCVSPRVPTSK